MANVLWIESAGQSAPQFSYPIVPPERIVPPDRAVEVFDRDRLIEVAVLASSVADPAPLARKLVERDETLEVLIVPPAGGDEAALDELRSELATSPHVQIAEDDESLPHTIAAAALRTVRRRQHIDARTALHNPPPGAARLRRPSSTQLADVLWNASPVGAIAVLHESFHVFSANRAAADLLETPEIDLIGKTLGTVLPEAADPWSWIQERGESESVARVVPHRTRQGALVYFELRAIEVEEGSDEVVLLLVRDVTEITELERLRAERMRYERAAREEAERAARVREDVLAIVAHDLRNPLQTLAWAAQSLEPADSERPAVADMVGMIQRATRIMLRLVNDLLDVSRIEGRGLPLDCESLPVADIVTQAVELTRSSAESQNIPVDIQVPDEALTIVGDRVRLVQLLQNLLANAIKFNESDKPITVAVTERDDKIRFSVCDRGPGIPADKIPHLFQRFWQIDRKDRRGLGLGLAIVRGITAAHGGTLTVDSAPGEGTAIHVDLPRVPPPEQA